MASFIRMEGQRAEIYYGYHCAAVVGRWVIEFGWLKARLGTRNPFQLTQSPLWFTVDNSASGRPPFERRLLEVTLTGDVLTARVGPRKG